MVDKSQERPKSYSRIMDTMDSEKKAIEEKKVTKPSDNVLTPEQTPSYSFGLPLVLSLLAIGLLVASIYFGILNP
jgi:hypothetical protein